MEKIWRLSATLLVAFEIFEAPHNPKIAVPLAVAFGTAFVIAEILSLLRRR